MLSSNGLQPYARSAGDSMPNGESATLVYHGQLYTFFATGQDTGGQITFFEGGGRRGAGPPPHIHTKEDEGIYVAEGKITVYVADQRIEASAGTFAFLPRGIEHWFTIESEIAKLLAFVTPGGHDGLFRCVGEPVTDLTIPSMPEGPPDLVKLKEAGDKYGIIFPRMK